MKVKRGEKRNLPTLEHGDKAVVVEATAGHDKGQLFCVLGQEGRFLYLANGRQRRLHTPKRKKLDHVEFLKDCAVDAIVYPQSDKELRRALAAFKEVITLGKR